MIGSSRENRTISEKTGAWFYLQKSDLGQSDRSILLTIAEFSGFLGVSSVLFSKHQASRNFTFACK
jgi:hypothetical protein